MQELGLESGALAVLTNGDKKAPVWVVCPKPTTSSEATRVALGNQVWVSRRTFRNLGRDWTSEDFDACMKAVHAPLPCEVQRGFSEDLPVGEAVHANCHWLNQARAVEARSKRAQDAWYLLVHRDRSLPVKIKHKEHLDCETLELSWHMHTT